MSDTITVTGLVATPPKHLVTREGLPITSFRLASTQRRFDRGEQKWVDADTNWYTITAFRHLASNAVGSLFKGQRVVVTGRLRIRDWEAGERTGTTIEIDAEAIGHDLTFGTAVFTRTPVATAEPVAEDPAAEAGDGETEPEAPVDEVAQARAKRPSELPVPF